ncbi:MAG: hypothetical protein RMJ55_15825 [Roseiflexaceae bacterium]|nr:hypothetical protein [Roseiflexaceae bacterium]
MMPSARVVAPMPAPGTIATAAPAASPRARGISAFAPSEIAPAPGTSPATSNPV